MSTEHIISDVPYTRRGGILLKPLGGFAPPLVLNFSMTLSICSVPQQLTLTLVKVAQYSCLFWLC